MGPHVVLGFSGQLSKLNQLVHVHCAILYGGAHIKLLFYACVADLAWTTDLKTPVQLLQGMDLYDQVWDWYEQ